MQVDWNEFDSKLFEKTLSEIVRIYFGIDLKSEEYKDKTFILTHKGRKMLVVVYRPYPISFEELSELAQDIIKAEASAGLIVSGSPQAFGFRLLERTPNCWFPIAVWGRTQVNAIVSMNSEMLTRIVPFKERSPSRMGSYGFTSMGKGGVLWSDIVKFVQLGINIGHKIGLNPADVRRRIISDIDSCFHRAGGLMATHWQKVGSDGWFHFYHDPSGPKVVQLAIDAMTQVRRIVASNLLYYQQDLKVVMGINETNNVQLDPGGPFDDDSIIAYLLLKEKYKQYDLRATQGAVLNLVDQSQQHQWLQYDDLPYFDGRKIKIYGHS